MGSEINRQNSSIKEALKIAKPVTDNVHLARVCNIKPPANKYNQNYYQDNITVSVI